MNSRGHGKVPGLKKVIISFFILLVLVGQVSAEHYHAEPAYWQPLEDPAWGDTDPLPLDTLPPALIVSHFALLVCMTPALAAPFDFIYGLSCIVFLISRREVGKSPLSHPLRSEIIACIRANPGINFSSIVDEVESNPGTVQYHLWVLRREGFLVTTEVGRQPGYFLPSQGYCTQEQQVLICLRNRTERKILCLLIQRPGINQSRIAELLNLSRSAVTWHMKRMDAIVSSWRDGRTVCYALESTAAEMLREEAVVSAEASELAYLSAEERSIA